VLNVVKLKHFFENIEKSEDEEDDAGIANFLIKTQTKH
jgi:hypothetical protein